MSKRITSDEARFNAQKHEQEMLSNLRMAAELERLGGHQGIDKFILLAGAHGAIATALWAMVTVPTAYEP